jgi:hypothetical protein
MRRVMMMNIFFLLAKALEQRRRSWKEPKAQRKEQS